MLAFAGNAGTCYHFDMPSLSVRKLDASTIERLRIRAATHGVSMEEEARRILQHAVGGPEQLGKLAYDLFGHRHGVELPDANRGPHEPLNFSE